MNTQIKLTRIRSILVIVLNAIFVISFALGLTTSPKQFNAQTPSSVVSVVCENGEFKSNNANITVSATQNVIADNVINGGYHFAGKEEYLTLTATNGQAFLSQQNGVTFTFMQRNTVADDTVTTEEDPVSYEQYITVEGEDGKTAHVAAGGLYYHNGSSATWMQTSTNLKALLSDTPKQVTVTINFVDQEVFVFVDGVQKQKLISSHSKYETVKTTIDLFKTVLSAQNSTIYLHKPCASKEKNNTTGWVMGNFTVHDELFTADKAFEFYQSTLPQEPEDEGYEIDPIEITYKNGAFASSNADYIVTPTETNIATDTVINGGWHYTSLESYVAVTATNNKPILTQRKGFTLTFMQRNTVNDGTVKTDDDPDPYEQLFTVEGENGVSAHLCPGGMYYYDGSATTYAQATTAHYGMLTTAVKQVTFAVDLKNYEMQVYFDGELAQNYNSTNNSNKFKVMQNIFDLFKSVLTTPNSTLYIRKPCEIKVTRNSTGMVLGDVTIHNKIFTAEEAQAFYELHKPVSPSFNANVKVENLGESDFVQTSVGSGFEENAEREGAFRFSDISSYLTVTPNSGKKLVSNNEGIAFHLWMRSTTDVFYNDANAVGDEVIDDFEQLFCVEGADGTKAFICTGGLYFLDSAGARTFAQPGEGVRIVLNTEWKYVSFVVNPSDKTIAVYVNGELAQHYANTANKAAVIANVVNLFTSVAYTEGGELHVRKPCVGRETRNTVSTIVDDLLITNGSLTQDQIYDYYDKAVGNARIRFIANRESAIIPDFVAKIGTPISAENVPEVSGYTFAGLYTDADFTTELTEGTLLNTSCTLYVKYIPTPYTITYHGATVENNPTSYTVESNGVTILDAQKVGYIFQGWYRTEDFKNKVTYLVPESFGNVDLYAKWQVINYSVTYITGGAVFESMPVENFTVESEIFALANAWKAHYDFEGWYLEESLSTNVTEINPAIASNVTLYAKWSPVVYTITYQTNGAEQIAELPTEYTVESPEMALSGLSKENYDFEGWYLEEDFINKVSKITPSFGDNLTLYAKWLPTTYKITYVLNGGNLQAGAKTTYTIEDGIVTLETPIKEGYVFEGWYLDETLTTKVTEIDASQAKNYTLYAKYSLPSCRGNLQNNAFVLCTTLILITVLYINKKRGVKA